MAGLKLTHKILIVIAVLFGLLKLSDSGRFKKRDQPQVVYIEVPRKQTPAVVVRAPEPKPVVRQRVAQVAASPTWVKPKGIVTPPAARMPRSITIDDSVMSSPPCESIHIDDDVFRQFYG